MQETQIIIDYILILSFLTLYGTVTWSLIRYSIRESYRYWAVGWVIYSFGALCVIWFPAEGLNLLDAITLAGMYVGSTLIYDGSCGKRITRKRISIYLIGIVLLTVFVVVGIFLNLPYYLVFVPLGFHIAYVCLHSAKIAYEIQEPIGQPKVWMIGGLTTWGLTWLMFPVVAFIPETYSVFLIAQAISVVVTGASMLTLFMRTVTRDLKKQHQVTQITSGLVQHDIRNYIQVARLALDLIENPSIVNDHWIDVASNSLDDARNFVDEMRDVTATLTRFKPNLEAQNLLTIINSAKNRVIQEYSLTSEQFKIQICEDITIFTCRLSKELFWNIFDNAFKHGSDSLNVVEIQSDSSKIKLEISDRGGGVSEKIKRFLNNTDSLSESVAPGVGLGLVLIQGLALLCSVQLHVDDVIEESAIVGTKYTLIFRTTN